MSRPLIIATVIGASVGIPYLASRSSTGQNGPSNAPPGSPFASTQQGAPTRLPLVTQPSASMPNVPGATAFANAVPRTARFTSVEQVFRFDVTREWVYQSWDRKSTGPTDVGLFSVRVPLVMAPQISGLAGSLTYYFNSNGAVEHISFRGRTGDTTPLVQLLTTTYQFQRVESPTGEQVYQVQYRGQVQSELRTRPEPILYSRSPNQSIAIELELARPGSERVLPPRPTGFEIPAVAATPATPAASPSASTEPQESATDSKGGSFFDKFRHATPQEEAQRDRIRWPN
jgi:uncharacterized protein DUF6690